MKAGTSAQYQLFQKSYILEKANFSEKQYSAVYTYFFWRTAFLERLLFQKTLPSIAATFSEELLFYNILFQKSYYFIATVPFHSYTSYLFASNQVNSVPVKCSLSTGVFSCLSAIAQSHIIDG